VRLALLAPLVFVALGAGCAPEGDAPPPAARVILLGVDGADWTVIERLIDDGRLPHFAEMRRDGASGVLRSHEPIFSPVVWASISTGVTPEVHGVTSFTVDVDGRPVPVTSNLVRAPRVWDILGDAGHTVGVIGWWSTWPATDVNGFLLSDRTWPITFGEHGTPVTSHDVPEIPHRTFPEPLVDSLDSLIVRREDLSPEHLARLDVSGPLGTVDNAGPSVADVYAKDLTFTAMSRHLYPAVRPDFFTVYLEITDVMAHYFWDSWRYSRHRRFGEPTVFTSPPKGMPPRKQRP